MVAQMVQNSFTFTIMFSVLSCSYSVFFLYSIWSYSYSANLYIFSLTLFIFSQLICIQSHVICIQSDLIYIQSSFKYIFSRMLHVFSLHLFFTNIFNVMSVTLRILLKSVLFWKKMKEMNACHTISYKEIKQTNILSIRKIFILVVML